MTQIRTAEEMILQKQKDVQDDYLAVDEIADICKEYAKQFIDAAADEARARTNDESTSIIVDKESILKLKELVK